MSHQNLTDRRRSGSGSPPAPSYAISGASSGEAGAESESITITGYNLTEPVEISYTSSDAGDTFDLATVTIDVGDNVKSIKITPDATVGVRTITFASNPDIADPSPWQYEATGITPSDPELTWTGDSSGEVGFASDDFTVSISNPPAGDTIITFVSDGPGDTFTVTTRTLNSGALSATVKVIAGTPGARNISITNNRSIANPAAVTYTASDPTYLAGFRTYAAGGFPPGLMPHQYNGIAYLYEPQPQSFTFV